MKAHPLFPYFLEKVSHPHISFFHLLVNGFLLLVSVLFPRPLPFLILVGSIGVRGKMVSASTPSANELAKDLILFHTVQLKPMIKAQISGRMVSSCISDVAIASVHSEKTRLKKLMKIMIIIITEKPFTSK